MMRTYSELIKMNTFEERFNYLKLNGQLGAETFGFDRYMNQMFYHSTEWRQIRNHVITRDNGHDLALPDDKYQILDRIYIHHMNPISPEDIKRSTDLLLNPEYLICVCKRTHDAIHYGSDSPEYQLVERSPNDQCPWKKR